MTEMELKAKWKKFYDEHGFKYEYPSDDDICKFASMITEEKVMEFSERLEKEFRINAETCPENNGLCHSTDITFLRSLAAEFLKGEK